MEINVKHTIHLSEDTKQFIKDILTGWHKLSDMEKVGSINKDMEVAHLAEVADIIREGTEVELITPTKEVEIEIEVEATKVDVGAVRSLAIEVGSDNMELVKLILEEAGAESITKATDEQLGIIYKKLQEASNGA